MYGYYEFDDVITLVDAERMLKAGNFVRPSSGEKPKQVCLSNVLAVGTDRSAISGVPKSAAVLPQKKLLRFAIYYLIVGSLYFYIDMRMYGFWEDELYWKAQEEYKVNFIRGIVTEITKKGDTVIVKGEDTTMGRPMEVPMDVVILSIGMEPSEGTKEMAKIFDIPLESHGFIETIGGALNTVEQKYPAYLLLVRLPDLQIWKTLFQRVVLLP